MSLRGAGLRPVHVFPFLLFYAASLPAATFYVTVAGLGGEQEYEQRFGGWASDIEKVIKDLPDAKVETLRGADATKANLRSALEKIARTATAQDAFVLMLIGHGTFDGFDYKINLTGPDISAIELATLLDRVPATRQLVVNMTSASGASLIPLRKETRVVISATKSGTEKNATIFARYWAEAMRDASADTDKNDTISALEAFRYAEKKTAQFYESQKRLATEHAVLEDTGKGEGVRAPSPENGEGLLAAAFPLLRAAAAAKIAADPEKAKLLVKKEDFEQRIDRLKYQKAAMPLDEYKKELSVLLLELAKTQAELDK